jgi:hypothetical protein
MIGPFGGNPDRPLVDHRSTVAAMPPRSVHALLTSHLRSIRDVAHDLQLEIHRAERDNGAGVTEMVAHIQRETKAALRLLGTTNTANNGNK